MIPPRRKVHEQFSISAFPPRPHYSSMSLNCSFPLTRFLLLGDADPTTMPFPGTDASGVVGAEQEEEEEAAASEDPSLNRRALLTARPPPAEEEGGFRRC